MGAEFAFDDGRRSGSEKWTGVPFEDGGTIHDNPSCRMAFGKDPEGNSFVLHQRK